MDVQKEPSIYMRFHVTLEKAIAFCKQLYKDSLVPATDMTRFHLALITAGLTQDILAQDYLDYHLTWLTGVLCDALLFNQEVFYAEIENILSELQDIQSNRIKQYISILTYNNKLPKGQRYKEMLNRVSDMDMIPCYIQIFRLYQVCKSMQDRKMRITKEEYEGFTAYAYLFWFRAISKHMPIGKNIRPYIKDFFKDLDKELGGMSETRKKADKLFKSI